MRPPPTEALPELPSLPAGLGESARLAAALEHLAAHGQTALRQLGDEVLLEHWEATVTAMLDPRSPARVTLDPWMCRAMRLSPAGLSAALETVGRGLLGDAAGAVFTAARRRPLTPAPAPALVVLPANLPGLALQSLLPALARRRPALFKSPSAEPWFTPALLSVLKSREPALGDAYAATVWQGGASPLEAMVFDACDPVIVYGDQPAVDALAQRARGRVIGFGPRFSVAVCHREATAEELAELARDVALGDQRGCLSVHALLTTSDADAAARSLAAALAQLARTLPPGPADPAAAAGARQALDDAESRGRTVYGDLAEGAVWVDTGEVTPSPGLRLVRVVPVRDLGHALALLAPWRGRLQGAATLRDAPPHLAEQLARLGVSRIAGPGELQYPDAAWHADGVDLLEVL